MIFSRFLGNWTGRRGVRDRIRHSLQDDSKNLWICDFSIFLGLIAASNLALFVISRFLPTTAKRNQTSYALKTINKHWNAYWPVWTTSTIKKWHKMFCYPYNSLYIWNLTLLRRSPFDTLIFKLFWIKNVQKLLEKSSVPLVIVIFRRYQKFLPISLEDSALFVSSFSSLLIPLSPFQEHVPPFASWSLVCLSLFLCN